MNTHLANLFGDEHSFFLNDTTLSGLMSPAIKQHAVDGEEPAKKKPRVDSLDDGTVGLAIHKCLNAQNILF